MKKQGHRRLRPALDALEERLALSTYGNAWPDPSHLTISFAPDGTKDGTVGSNLYQSLQGLNAGGNDWQVTMLRAFQTWEQYANVNLGLVADGGQDFGTTGAVEGDGRFGDIRIGAIPQTVGTLALTQPLSFAAGTWAGDMNLDSSAGFGINKPDSDDLFTVALHEAGHALGLDDNTDPTSVMFDSYIGPRTSLSPADIQAIQAIYGARPGDAGNSGFDNAAPLVLISPDGRNAGTANTTVNDSLATPRSRDYYALGTPATDPGPTSFQLKAGGLSLLEATLTVYDAQHNVVGTAIATDPRQNNLTVTLPGLTPNSTYYVSVGGASGDAFAVGSYQLRAIPDSVDSTAVAAGSTYPTTDGFINLNTANGTIGTATSLLARANQVGPNNYFSPGSLSTASEVHYYSFTTPRSVSPGTRDVMTLMVYGTASMPVDAVVAVYNASGQVVPSNVIEHVNGSYVIQVPNAPLNSTLYARVAAYNPGSSTAIGNFGLSITFGSSVEDQSQIAGGTLTQQGGASINPRLKPSSKLTLANDTLYDFNLAATTGGANQAVFVQMAITDATGKVVGTLQTRAGQVQSLQIWLVAGTYTISFTEINNSGSAASPLNYTLFAEELSDPIKVFSSTSSGTSASKPMNVIR